MKTRILIIASLFITLSCKQNLTERHYQSTDFATGGFNDFLLNLNSNGQLDLTIKSSKTVGVFASGNSYEMPTKTILGKWTMDDDKIICTFDEPRSSIDSFYSNTDFKNIFSDRPIVTFSQKLDTAFVLGIPCLLTTKK